MPHQRCLQTETHSRTSLMHIKLVMIKHAVDNLAISKDRNHELGSSCNSPLKFEVFEG
jgi:hypothetical protein